MKSLFFLATLSSTVNAYWLMSVGTLTPEPQRVDPILSPGAVSSHSHYVLGGSNFRQTTDTASLRSSECTTTPIAEDKSSYWYPNLYFEWANGSFSSLTGGNVMCVIYYLFDDDAAEKNVTAFPDDFRMISGTPTLRTYNASSYAQQAVTFLCLDFTGTTTKFNSIPPQACASGIRAQINFPSCWDGVNTDSTDHKSHVAFLSGGPDSGTCEDPNFPVRLPRIFLEVYWSSGEFDSFRDQAKNSTQPFVFSFGDPTGYGYHADFINGWDDGALQKAVDNCHCDEYGSPQCCADQGIFTYQEGKECYITDIVDEKTSGLLTKLPGNNPVQQAGIQATVYTDDDVPGFLEPVYVYTGSSPTATATATEGGSTAAGSTGSAAASSASSTFTSIGNVGAVIQTTASSSSTESSPSSTEVTSASAEAPSSTEAASQSTESTSASTESSSDASESTSVAAPAASSSASSTSAGGHAHHTHDHAAASSSSSSSSGACRRESRRDDFIDHSSRFRRTHRRHMDYDAYTF
ncbi:WSC domain-containing protein [Desarmillaria tabescens]|uniref:WSC domain-containing protein n=1 Tax=Armillaria tabescens TaxID=1929756 RepID=A0AA39NQW4_ARMTA|nr:WSC domain-containing protein [Desarmillaria tabescens]KAK0470163.1 WSC domain-containing protein [Desarmillaria tabescens]